MTRDLRKLADQIERECVQLGLIGTSDSVNAGIVTGVVFRTTVCVELLEKFRDSVLEEAEKAVMIVGSDNVTQYHAQLACRNICALKSGKQ